MAKSAGWLTTPKVLQLSLDLSVITFSQKPVT
jgi:hypothetical protein